MSGCPHLKGPLHDFDKAKEQKLEKCKGGTLVREGLLDPYYMSGLNTNPYFVFDAAFVKFV